MREHWNIGKERAERNERGEKDDGAGIAERKNRNKEKKEIRKENRNIEQKEMRGRLGLYSREERKERGE